MLEECGMFKIIETWFADTEPIEGVRVYDRSCAGGRGEDKAGDQRSKMQSWDVCEDIKICSRTLSKFRNLHLAPIMHLNI